MWQRTIDCLGVSVAVESDVTSISAQLTAVFRTYADAAGAPALSYRLAREKWPVLERDGVRVRGCDQDIDLVAALELDLYPQVARRAKGLVLHAAAVVGKDGRALVFAGESGAGKSTLMRALLKHGYAYLSEECVAIADEGACLGLSRALHVDEPEVALPDSFHCDVYELSTPAGIRRSRLFHPPVEKVWRRAARAVAIVVLSHGADADNKLARLGSGASLLALWPTMLRQDVSDAVARLDEVPCHSLRTTHPEIALERALALASELGIDVL